MHALLPVSLEDPTIEKQIKIDNKCTQKFQIVMQKEML